MKVIVLSQPGAEFCEHLHKVTLTDDGVIDALLNRLNLKLHL